MLRTPSYNPIMLVFMAINKQIMETNNVNWNNNCTKQLNDLCIELCVQYYQT